MTKDEFVAAWGDEMTGLLLAAFAAEKKAGDFSADGRFFVQQMRRARDLLGRIYERDIAKPVQAKPEAKPTNGAAQPQGIKR